MSVIFQRKTSLYHHAVLSKCSHTGVEYWYMMHWYPVPIFYPSSTALYLSVVTLLFPSDPLYPALTLGTTCTHRGGQSIQGYLSVVTLLFPSDPLYPALTLGTTCTHRGGQSIQGYLFVVTLLFPSDPLYPALTLGTTCIHRGGQSIQGCRCNHPSTDNYIQRWPEYTRLPVCCTCLL